MMLFIYFFYIKVFGLIYKVVDEGTAVCHRDVVLVAIEDGPPAGAHIRPEADENHDQ